MLFSNTTVFIDNNISPVEDSSTSRYSQRIKDLHYADNGNSWHKPILQFVRVIAHVTPIHKSGSKELPNNYIPISLIMICCKMLEHIVLHYLNKALGAVLHNRQHGFRKRLSCDTQLCSTYHDFAKAHDEPLTMPLYRISKRLSTRHLTPSRNYGRFQRATRK